MVVISQFLKVTISSCDMPMSWCAVAPNTVYMRLCSVSTVTCVLCAAVSLGTAEHMARTMTSSRFPGTFSASTYLSPASKCYPRMDGRRLLRFARCACSCVVASPMAVGVRVASPEARSVRPVAPDLPTFAVCPLTRCLLDAWLWFPSHHCKGAFAFVCLETLTCVVHPVPIPCHLDHSYEVEVYTSWVLCRVNSALLTSAHAACATACNLREGGNFTDSKSFIMALRSRCPSELGIGLVDLWLADCIDQATPFPPTQHLYSHQEGHFLDRISDDVDNAAKA